MFFAARRNLASSACIGAFSAGGRLNSSPCTYLSVNGAFRSPFVMPSSDATADTSTSPSSTASAPSTAARASRSSELAASISVALVMACPVRIIAARGLSFISRPYIELTTPVFVMASHSALTASRSFWKTLSVFSSFGTTPSSTNRRKSSAAFSSLNRPFLSWNAFVRCAMSSSVNVPSSFIMPNTAWKYSWNMTFGYFVCSSSLISRQRTPSCIGSTAQSEVILVEVTPTGRHFSK